MKNFFLLIFLFIIFAFASTNLMAQDSIMPICPPNVVGSGARAKGIGDAFVAIADDATAASWNPAGLVQLQNPEISLVLSYDHRLLKAKSIENGEIMGAFESKEKIDLIGINYLSMVYPFSIARRNITFSLNYQRLYDFKRDLDGKIYYKVDGVISDTRSLSYKGDGSLYTISPAASVQITPDFFCGITVNIWHDKYTKQSNWENTFLYKVDGDPNIIIKANEKFKDFKAINANLGFFWMLNPYLTIAGVYKTPFYDNDKVLGVKREFNGEGIITDPNSLYDDYDIDINKIKFPPVYGIGVASRISDSLTLSFDISRTDWDKYKLEDKDGHKFGLFADISDPNILSPKVKPTYSVKFGLEYLKIFEKTVVPFRGGFFYDPLPSKNNPLDVYGITMGTGISLGKFILDIAYQRRFIDNVPGDEAGLNGVNIKVDEWHHQILLSGIYHF